MKATKGKRDWLSIATNLGIIVGLLLVALQMTPSEKQ